MIPKTRILIVNLGELMTSVSVGLLEGRVPLQLTQLFVNRALSDAASHVVVGVICPRFPPRRPTPARLRSQ